MRAMNFGEHILTGVGPLVEPVEGADSVSVHRNATKAVEADLRQSPWSVGIRIEVLFHPPGGIGARLIDQTGAKSVIPEQCCGTVVVVGAE